jgi:hypothetical protein
LIPGFRAVVPDEKMKYDVCQIWVVGQSWKLVVKPNISKICQGCI